MTLSKIASQVAKIEGKKSQTSIGNIRETIKALMLLEAAMRVAEHFELLDGSLLASTDFNHSLESEAFETLRLETAKLAEKAYVKELKRRAKEFEANEKAYLKEAQAKAKAPGQVNKKSFRMRLA